MVLHGRAVAGSPVLRAGIVAAVDIGDGAVPECYEVVTLDAGVATGTIKAKEGAGSQAKIVTFDLNNDVVRAIQNKTIEFCVDQQPYLQGYEAVDTLWLQLTNGNDLGGGKAVLTGPSFVDSTNIEKIATFAAKNTR